MISERREPTTVMVSVPNMADVAAVIVLKVSETLKPDAWRRQVIKCGNMRTMYAVTTIEHVGGSFLKSRKKALTDRIPQEAASNRRNEAGILVAVMHGAPA